METHNSCLNYGTPFRRIVRTRTGKRGLAVHARNVNDATTPWFLLEHSPEDHLAPDTGAFCFHEVYKEMRAFCTELLPNHRVIRGYKSDHLALVLRVE